MFDLRLKVVAAIVFLMMAAVVARLGYMQVAMCDYYREEARKRQIKDFTVPAPRGVIMARDGTILAEDYPTWSVCVVLRDFNTLSLEGKQDWYSAVAAIVGDSPSHVADQVRRVYFAIEERVARQAQHTIDSGKDKPARLADKARRDAGGRRKDEYKTKQPIYVNATWPTVAKAEVASAQLPGLAVGQSMARRYPMGSLACHAIGMVGEASPDEVDMYATDYNGDERKSVRRDDDVMGRSGLEKQYNFSLRGSRGETTAIVNANGQKQVVLSDVQPEAGATITLGIDPILQSVAEKALGGIFAAEHHPGAAVCMDAHTGEVLVLASSPSYDLNTFSADFATLTDVNNPDGGKYRPLQNRAVASGYPLGSVFKIVTTTAALETHAITPQTVFTCTGTFQVGKATFRCDVYRPPQFLTHGTLDLLDGFKESCNIYFFNAGLRAGGENLNRWGRKYGLGSPTGVDLPGETSGKVPVPKYTGDTVNLSIGQGALLVSPVQVCRMVAAVANGGMLLTPHLYKDAAVSKPDPVGFSASTLDMLRRGMYKVVNEQGGTAYKVARSDVMPFSGKTGTAQAPPEGDQKGDHAWFAGFAPSDKPEIAFAIVVEHGGFGGTAAAPVAKALVEAFAAEKAATVKQ